MTCSTEGSQQFTHRRDYKKASRLLAFQPHKDESNRIVQKIKKPNNDQTLTQPEDVAEAFSAYYKKLYKREDEPHKIKIFFN